MLVNKSVTTETKVSKMLVSSLVSTQTIIGGWVNKALVNSLVNTESTLPLCVLSVPPETPTLYGMSIHICTRESVLEAIRHLHSKGVLVTRKSLHEHMGEPLGKLREHIDSLIENHHVQRLDRGIYAPVLQHTNRAVTVTAMPDGLTKVEIGDDVLTLTPVESGCLGQLLHGFVVAVRRA